MQMQSEGMGARGARGGQQSPNPEKHPRDKIQVLSLFIKGCYPPPLLYELPGLPLQAGTPNTWSCLNQQSKEMSRQVKKK